MRRTAVYAVLVGASLACGAPSVEIVERTAPPPAPAVCAPSEWASASQRVLAQGLDTPWGMTVAPDGRIYVTERPGRVRLIDSTGLRAEPWATLPVAAVGESGLLGIMLAPDYATSGALLVSGTYATPGRSRSALSRVWRRALRTLGVDPGTDFDLQVHRLQRARVEAGEEELAANRSSDGAIEATLVFQGVPAAPLHPGGAMLALGADVFLLSTGDASEPWTAERDGDPRGKLLSVRYTAGGNVARVGAGATVVAHGVRNPQGIVRLSGDSPVFFIDHGPTGSSVEGGRSGRDELNRFIVGSDYGWPRESGIHVDGLATRPMLEWTTGIAPAGLAVVADAASPSARMHLFVSSLRGQGLRRVELARRGETEWDVVCEESVLDATRGRVRAVAAHPEGGVVVATSNRDSRGAPRPGDDQVIWLQPQATP